MLKGLLCKQMTPKGLVGGGWACGCAHRSWHLGGRKGKYHMKQLQHWGTGPHLGPSGAEVVKNDSRLCAKRSCADIIGFSFYLCCGRVGSDPCGDAAKPSVECGQRGHPKE